MNSCNNAINCLNVRLRLAPGNVRFVAVVRNVPPLAIAPIKDCLSRRRLQRQESALLIQAERKHRTEFEALVIARGQRQVPERLSVSLENLLVKASRMGFDRLSLRSESRYRYGMQCLKS